VCVYIYIYSGYILSIRSGIVEAAQTLPRAGKNSKIENLVRVSLIA
jgi:hypothetical protein